MPSACRSPAFYRLNEVSIRHRDDYWFGKLKLYGVTLPHYWSSLNAPVYSLFGHITGDASWLFRADTVISAKLSFFAPDGRASCAHVDSLASNGHPAAKDDPWAND